MTPQDFETAYGLGYPRTVAFLRSRGLERDTAIEVAQGAWVRGWEKLAQLRDQTMLMTWINRIAVNLSIANFRKARRETPLSEIHMRRAITNQHTDAVDLALLLRVCRPCDRTLLEEFVTGASIGEIAAKKNATPTAIRVRLVRARRVVRDHCASVRQARHPEAPTS
jgi:DNA-directed RNA polymerase specialized sigma24 family protein